MPEPISEKDYRELRHALQHRALSDLILALEDRGVRLWLTEAGTLRCKPMRLVTPDEVATLRQHADVAKTLVRLRQHWTRWPQPVPKFDPKEAFGPRPSEEVA